MSPERQDLSRSEQILREGLATVGVRDSVDIADRLVEVFKEQGRSEEEAAEFFRRMEASAPAVKVSRTISAEGSLLREKTKLQFGGGGLPLDQLPALRAGLLKAPEQAAVARQKVGRNEPCPCGSGKKFKKCCGA
jgi:preprotein translocase subunit SecA